MSLGLPNAHSEWIAGIQASPFINRAYEVHGISVSPINCHGSDRECGALVNAMIAALSMLRNTTPPSESDESGAIAAQVSTRDDRGLVKSLGDSAPTHEDPDQTSSGVSVGLMTEHDGFDGVNVGIVNTAVRLRGIQIGLLNMTGGGTGLQLGLLNSAHRFRGVQLGLINAIKDGRRPAIMLGVNARF